MTTSTTDSLDNLVLITGGARSGKSTFAESSARALNGHVVYIATMCVDAADGESIVRVDRHKSRRPSDWKTIEEPVDIALQIDGLGNDVQVCLIDCLSLWLANLLPHLDDEIGNDEFIAIERKISDRGSELLKSIADKPRIQFIIVTNEVGFGIVPTNVVARFYRDLLGTLNQKVAAAAGRVWLCCVGLQLPLKS